MRRMIVVILAISLFGAAPAYAEGLMDKIKEYREQKDGKSGEPDNNTIIAGLKEALPVGAKNGVTNVSKQDGYFGNPKIKIPMPEKVENTEKMMRKFGMNKEADDFILSMNRAAEKAAPQALKIFTDAVKEMTITDAVGILHGKDTAATDYLKSKTHTQIHAAFKPIISQTVNEVGVTHAFKKMMEKASKIPFLKKETVDLDEYVTNKALDGLFVVVGQEEQKIRKDPVARVTELLKAVFK